MIDWRANPLSACTTMRTFLPKRRRITGTILPRASTVPSLLRGIALTPLANQQLFDLTIALIASQGPNSKPGQHGGDSIQMAPLDFMFESHDISIEG